jgi:predicted AlkP superfamily pyrophosphatase or phosphodiesterase
MRPGLRSFVIAAVLIVLAAGVRPASGPTVQAPSRATPPRLIVILVVDQFRGAYVTQYGHQWSAGLRRLFDTGAVFPLSGYTYATTTTCPGHATIATGTQPATHGMINNQWYDRATQRSVVCSEDAAVAPVSFGAIEGREHHGPARLLTPTFADELRLQSAVPPRIVGLSLKPRSAILLAGRGAPGTIAVWTEPNGAWTTSTAYTSTPWPEVNEFVTANPISAAYGRQWTRLLEPAEYRYDDVMRGEPAANTFPHTIVGRSGKPDASFASAWHRSPMSDAYLGELAASLVTRLKLGQGPAIDLLGVSFSALDLVGHSFGPRSHEVQDLLAQVDQTIGRLMTVLDRHVGEGRYVLALTGDHGVPDMPEQAADLGMRAGRISMSTLRRTLEDTLVKELGTGPHVAAVSSPHIYFTPDTLAKLRDQPRVRQVVTSLLAATAGVHRVIWADGIANAPAVDPVLNAVHLSHVPDRSGDVVLVFDPYWIAQSTGTTHGSPYAYDQRVPLVLLGAGIAPGRYLTTAGPVDIAPTLAHLAGIAMARTDGRILIEALAR